MRTRVYYGWFIVAVCMLMVFGASLVTTGMAVSLRALRDEMGFSGTETSLITTVCALSAFISIFFADRFFKKVGMRNGMFMVVACGAVAFLIYSLAGSNIYLYFLGSVFGGIDYGLGFMLSTSIIVRRWFNERRAFALALCSAGSGLSIMIGTPILEMIIENVSIQASFAVEAVYMGAVAVLVFIIIRNDPSLMGLEPLGGKDFIHHQREDGKYTMTAPLLALLFVAAMLGGISGSPATSNFALNFTNVGLNPTTVAFAISVFGIMLMVTKLIYGSVVDRKGALFATLFFGLFMVIGQFGCFFIGNYPENWLMFATLAILGMGYPIITLGYPNWSADFSTVEGYPTVLKKLQLGYQFGILAGSPLPGLIADSTGHFTWAYLLFSILMLTSVVCVAIAYGRAKRSTTVK